MAQQRRRHSSGERQARRPGSNALEKAGDSQQSTGSRFKHGILALVLVFFFLAWYFHYSRDPLASSLGGGEDLFYRDILKAASRAPRLGAKRKLNGTVLAYVTPWNSKGYDMAKKFRHKLTHVSPVWYQLRRDDKGMSLAGKHDVDQGWISEVRKQGFPLIVPRVVLEGWSLDSMLVSADEKQKAIKLILEECKEQAYDGIVLEAWNSWASYRILENHRLREKALAFIRELGSSLHKLNAASATRPLQLVLVIPPERGGGPEEFTRGDLHSLQHAVDGFSLMTYDFSNAYRPGPNAPLPWIRSCLNSLLAGKSNEVSSKILMGINFYGNDYVLPRGGGAIVGDQFLELLKEYTPKLVWDSMNREHYFDYSKDQNKHRVYFPTAKSVTSRLEESVSAGVGVSIWEIGQGLEHFFDLL
ncbi:chitinase domain-containing protein 1 [Selaginella moellendorffii]|uniref:chitinase domain-containing protein 1 n=1 Tax=Selaginella moellendorffii TaxID=88036 RepID=UPI000D1CA1A1|nr:chitinase domain-containing protein 1 [Selaginella moellendorffii]|eukprot:XP_024538957.1 chitinase domain-containing protein 1 [Selaginella moellendorffii]